jgi:predicted nucleotidyltransferase
MEALLSHGLDLLLDSSCKLSPSIVGMVLYGSAARGTTTPNSDIDVLVVLSADTPLRRGLYNLVDQIKGIDPKVSVALVHLPASDSTPGGIWLEVASHGRILHDPSGSVREAIARLREHISAGRSVRLTTHGQGFWVHHAE